MVNVVVCLEEDRGLQKSQGWLKRLFGSIMSAKSTMGLFDQPMTEIQQQYQCGSKLRVEILPRLASPKVGDVRRWLDHELVKSSVPYLPEKEIEAIFQGRDSFANG